MATIRITKEISGNDFSKAELMEFMNLVNDNEKITVTERPGDRYSSPTFTLTARPRTPSAQGRD